ncbi:TonB-dependent receptor domain-containing protein [Chitinophaga barathri]|uniref:TonB-dependent receptor n=1 Tax=Chitinophaga barathri TaxID=1647451 RepID=A0A3N4M7H6_9BACT|nr:TonB-dependent receptor [Chitinophaga barathri]RPD39392.1 hypothetical protein EG028_19915 [Chitinophaga barathri]
MRYRIILRLVLLFLVLGCATQFPRAQTPDRKITFPQPKTTVGEAIKAIEKQTTLQFSYGSNVLQRTGRGIVLGNSTVTLEKVLQAMQAQAGIRYELDKDNRIILKTEDAGQPKSTAQSSPDPGKTITGKVLDAEKKTPVPGVSVGIKHTGRGTTTNVEGEFRLTVPATGAILVFSFIGYAPQEVHVRDAANITIRLASSQKMLGGVTVSAIRNHNTDEATLSERKKSAVISDAISAQQIERTASITTTQALQRVAGVSVTDDKYVAIRGLGDRSVIAELNGARLSSADPDRTAVPLDLVPAALLDNITIYKTLSADRPADASAGIIELKTKSVPTALTLEVAAQAGFNSAIGLNGKYNGFYNDNLGFLGQEVKSHQLSGDFLRLAEQYPGGLKQMQEVFIQSRNNPALANEAMRISDIMQSFDPVLTSRYKTASPNQLYSVSFGNSFKIFGGRHKLGVVINGNYYQRYEDIYQGERNQYSLFQGVVTGSPKIFNQLRIPNFISPAFPRLGNYLSYQENTGRRIINYGGLLGLAYQFNPRHVIQFQYVGSRGAEAVASSLSGEWKNSGLNYPVYNYIDQLKLTYRTFNTFNLQGEHKFISKDWSPRLTYNLSSSNTIQDEPDYRSSNYAVLRSSKQIATGGAGIGEDVYAFVTGLTHGVGSDYTRAIVTDPNGRQFRKLTEKNYNAKMDLTFPFQLYGEEQVIKIGGNFLRRERDYRENVLGLPGSNLGGGGTDLLNKVKGDIDQLVSSRYVGMKDPSSYNEEGQPRVGGFLYQIKKSPNNYTGTYETRAFYIMADARVGGKLRINGGVRFEGTIIDASVDTANVFFPPSLDLVSNLPGVTISNVTDRPFSSYRVNYKPYYSTNITYAVREDMNLRLAYGTSLARPELRELTNIYLFDPFQFAVVAGNPTLQNQFTRSYDFRWEWFTAPREVLAVSAFGKHISNQLQKVFSYKSQGNLSTSPEFPLINFQNDPNPGRVYGLEFEARRSMEWLWPSAFRNLFFNANLMLAMSRIKKNPERLDASRINDRRSPETSPVFEQAPYSINVGLGYLNHKSQTDVNLNFNMTGARLVQVQLDGTPDIFDRPLPMLDLVFTQRLNRHFVVKGFAKNILNPYYRQVYTNAGNNGEYHGHTYVYRQYKKGSEFSLGIAYKIL